MDKNIKCDLFLTDEEKNMFSTLRIETLKEDLENLPPLQSEVLSIDGIYMYEEEDVVEVSTFIRNATSKAIDKKILPVVIKDKKNEKKIGAQVFRCEELGEIPPYSARPYKLFFKKENISGNIELDNWKVEISKDIYDFNTLVLGLENLPSTFPKERLFDLTERLSVKPGQNNIVSYELGTTEKGKVYLVIIINNGTENSERLEVLPVTITDNEEKLVLKGMFKIDTGVIKPYSSKLCTLVFEDKDVNLNEFDMSNFKVEFYYR